MPLFLLKMVHIIDLKIDKDSLDWGRSNFERFDFRNLSAGIEH